jgi:hypothetical protein
MTTKYDSDRFRVLGVGERVEKGDYYLDPFAVDHGEPPQECGRVVGTVVRDDDDWTYLRPIAEVPAGNIINARVISTQRKATPVATGVLDYFPDAIRAVANCSHVGNAQHNPGTPMHWDRAKSGDEADALVRHLMERGTMDSDGVRHTTKVAWRALALLQKELEGAQ